MFKPAEDNDQRMAMYYMRRGNVHCVADVIRSAEEEQMMQEAMMMQHEQQQMMGAQQINAPNSNASYLFGDMNGMNNFNEGVPNANMSPAPYYYPYNNNNMVLPPPQQPLPQPMMGGSSNNINENELQRNDSLSSLHNYKFPAEDTDERNNRYNSYQNEHIRENPSSHSSPYLIDNTSKNYNENNKNNNKNNNSNVDSLSAAPLTSSGNALLPSQQTSLPLPSSSSSSSTPHSSSPFTSSKMPPLRQLPHSPQNHNTTNMNTDNNIMNDNNNNSNYTNTTSMYSLNKMKSEGDLNNDYAASSLYGNDALDKTNMHHTSSFVAEDNYNANRNYVTNNQQYNNANGPLKNMPTTSESMYRPNSFYNNINLNSSTYGSSNNINSRSPYQAAPLTRTDSLHRYNSKPNLALERRDRKMSSNSLNGKGENENDSQTSVLNGRVIPRKESFRLETNKNYTAETHLNESQEIENRNIDCKY